MFEGAYYKVNVNGAPEGEEPLLASELHEHQYIKLQQPEGVNHTVRVAEHEVTANKDVIKLFYFLSLLCALNTATVGQ